MSLTKYVTERKSQIKRNFLTSSTLSGGFSIVLEAYEIYGAFTSGLLEYKDGSILVFLTQYLIENPKEIILDAIIGIIICGIVIFFSGYWFYYQNTKFLRASKTLIEEYGFESINGDYIQGQYNSFTVRMELIKDENYFNTVLVSFLVNRNGAGDSELKKQISNVALFAYDTFGVVVKVEKQDNNFVTKYILEKYYLGPHESTPTICLFVDKVAGNSNKTPSTSKLLNRLDRLIELSESMPYVPMTVENINKLELSKQIQGMRLYAINAK